MTKIPAHVARVYRAAMKRWEWWDKVAPANHEQGRYLLGLLQEACAAARRKEKRK